MYKKISKMKTISTMSNEELIGHIKKNHPLSMICLEAALSECLKRMNPKKTQVDSDWGNPLTP